MIFDAIDGCAGPGGWSEAMRILGLSEVGIEYDAQACATRRAAGHLTIRADVAAFPVEQLRRRVRGVIFSPPCGGMSKSGAKVGVGDLPLVLELLDRIAAGEDVRAQYAEKMADFRSHLMAEPLRYALAIRPEWVALEQVPAALPLWEATARHLEAAGYSTWTGILDASDYGVPQVRKRAILIASRVRTVAVPEPTHGDCDEGMLFGTGRRRRVSMADALGWGYTQRPAPTVTGGGTATGGPEPFGNGTRRAMRNAMGDLRLWKPRPGVGHAENHVGLTQAEAAVLQSFRPDYLFQGRKGAVALQCGNAIPPALPPP